MINFYAWTGYAFWFIVCAFVFFSIGLVLFGSVRVWRERRARNMMADFLNAHFLGEETWYQIVDHAETAAAMAIEKMDVEDRKRDYLTARAAISAYFDAFNSHRKKKQARRGGEGEA